MKIGFIGAGHVGQRLATQFLKAGHSVVLSNSRGPESLSDLATSLGSGAKAGTIKEAGSQEIVVLATLWPAVSTVLNDLPDWNGRILIDATNQIPDPILDGPVRGSQLVAQYAPGANVIKAFNTLFARFMDGEIDSGRRVLFFAGDSSEAKQRVKLLFEKLGYAPVDLGDLAQANPIMEFPAGPLSGTHFIVPKNELE